MSSRLRRRCIFGQCPGVEFIRQVAADSATGASTPETFTYSQTPAVGNLLVLVFNHGGGNGAASAPAYATPSGWTKAGQAYNNLNSGGTDWFASTVVYYKTATASESSVSLSWTGGHGGRADGRIYEYTPGYLDQVVTYDGVPSPTATETMELTARKASVFFAVTTAATASGFNPDLVETDLNDFTLIFADTDTTFKSANYRRDELPAGTIDLPILTNPQDGGGLYPYAVVAASFSRCPTENIQDFTTAGAHTWTKPAGRFRYVDITTIGAGAGGASGNVASVTNSGGGGGSSGLVVTQTYDLTELDATEAVTVGAGGAGGLGVTGTTRNDGVDGGDTYVTVGVGETRAAGGNGGGTIVPGTGLASGGASAGTGGGTGGDGESSGAGSAGTTASGGGGGCRFGGVLINGYPGGADGGTAGTLGVADTSGGGAGGAGTVTSRGGGGGGGGAAGTGNPPRAGGAGGWPGGGGGGGGANRNNTSGAGGAGADGAVRIRTYW
jgi:hypothetical protein